MTLCRNLKRLGAEVAVTCLREQGKDNRSLRPEFEREEIPVRNLGADSRWDWRFIHRVSGLVRSERPDVLHTHLPRADLAGAVASFFSPSIPWMCSVHDIYSESWSGRWTLPIFNYVWRRPDVVVAISQAVKDWLVNVRRVPASKVEVVHYGIEPERVASRRTDLRVKWGLNGKLVMGSIGRLEARKGHETLIKAMPATLKEVPDARLLIAGHDPWGYGHNLRSLVHQLDLEERVNLVGFQDDIPSFLHALDVFVFASTSEGFGQVVIEAMSAGKAVVATNIPPLNEIVVNGETGLVAEPIPEAFADALVELLLDPEKSARMGERGRQRVRTQFSAERMARETLAVYKSLL